MTFDEPGDLLQRVGHGGRSDEAELRLSRALGDGGEVASHCTLDEVADGIAADAALAEQVGDG